MRPNHPRGSRIDNALTRPWTVNKRYVRVRNPIYVEAICSEGNDHLKIQGEDYMRPVLWDEWIRLDIRDQRCCNV